MLFDAGLPVNVFLRCCHLSFSLFAMLTADGLPSKTKDTATWRQCDDKQEEGSHRRGTS
jgi:hypothetical protein